MTTPPPKDPMAEMAKIWQDYIQAAGTNPELQNSLKSMGDFWQSVMSSYAQRPFSENVSSGHDAVLARLDAMEKRLSALEARFADKPV